MLKSFVASCIPHFLFARRLPAVMGNRVLLTFDDGPHPEVTPTLLQVLAEYDARAIFFVVGDRIPRAPHMMRAIEDAGHLIGNHSYSHPIEEPFRYREYLQDLRRCQEAVTKHDVTPPRFHRPPLGSISFATAVVPIQLGLRTLLWSHSSEDWRFQSDAEAISSADELGTVLQRRDILLMHDEKPYTVTLLKHLLPVLADRGLRFDWPRDSRI